MGRAAVHPSGDHLFSRTGVSAEQNRHIGMADLFHAPVDNRHRRGTAKYNIIGGHMAGAAQEGRLGFGSRWHVGAIVDACDGASTVPTGRCRTYRERLSSMELSYYKTTTYEE